MAKIKLLAIMLLIVFVGTVAADDFNVFVVKQKTDIFPNETAKFTIDIENKYDSEKRFRFYFPNNLLFNVITDPVRNSGVLIQPNESVSTEVSLTTKNAGPERYLFPVRVVADGEGDEKKVNVEIWVKETEPFEPPELDPKIVISDGWPKLSSGGEIDPRDDLRVQVEFKNKNQLDIEDMDVTLTSTLTSMEETKQLDIAPVGRSRVNFEVEYADKQMPTSDTLELTWEYNQTEFGPEEMDVEIVGYKQPFEIERSKSEKFLKENKTVVVENPGTLPNTEEVRVPVSWLESKFIETTPEYERMGVVDGERYLFWTVDLEAFGTTEINTHANYASLFWTVIVVLVLAVLGVAGYMFFRHPLKIHKKLVVQKVSDGGITRMKILLNVKNTTNKRVDGVLVVDNMPNIATVEKQEDEGVVAPTKILRHQKSGTVLKWELGQLEPNEERILTYKIHAKLAVVGDILLPPASIKYKDGSANRVVKSNKCYFANE